MVSRRCESFTRFGCEDYAFSAILHDLPGASAESRIRIGEQERWYIDVYNRLFVIRITSL